MNWRVLKGSGKYDYHTTWLLSETTCDSLFHKNKLQRKVHESGLYTAKRNWQSKEKK